MAAGACEQQGLRGRAPTRSGARSTSPVSFQEELEDGDVLLVRARSANSLRTRVNGRLSQFIRLDDRSGGASDGEAEAKVAAEAKRKSARKVPTKFGEKEAPDQDGKANLFSGLHFWSSKNTVEVPSSPTPDTAQAKRSILRKVALPEPEQQQRGGSWHGAPRGSGFLSESEALDHPSNGPLQSSGSVIGSIIGYGSSGSFPEKSNCEVCQRKIGKHNFASRHNCRICWRTVCSGCSPSTIKMDGYSQLQRVCDPCIRTVTQVSSSSNVPIKLAAVTLDARSLLDDGKNEVPRQESQEGTWGASLDPFSVDESLAKLEEYVKPISLIHKRSVGKVQQLGEKLRVIAVGGRAQDLDKSSAGQTESIARTRSLLTGTSSDTPRRNSSVGALRRGASMDRRRSTAEQRENSADVRRGSGVRESSEGRRGKRSSSGALRPPESDGLQELVSYVGAVVSTLEARQKKVAEEIRRTNEAEDTLREDIAKAEAHLASLTSSTRTPSISSSMASSMSTPLLRPSALADDGHPSRRKCPCGCAAPPCITLFGQTTYTLRT